MSSVLHTFGDYQLWINKGSTDVDIVRPVLLGSEYDKYMEPDSDDVWLDAGAHVGAFSIRYCNTVSKIIAVEPNKVNYQLLLKNLSAYDCSNVTPLEVAVVGGDSCDMMFGISDGKDRSSGSLLPIRRKQRYKVKCVNISELLDKHGVTCIKMDIEGAEYECIMSLTREDMSYIKMLIFEHHFNMLHEIGTGDLYFQLLDHLRTGFDEVIAREDIKRNWNIVACARNHG